MSREGEKLQEDDSAISYRPSAFSQWNVVVTAAPGTIDGKAASIEEPNVGSA